MNLLKETQLRLFRFLPGLRLALSGFLFSESDLCGTDGETYYYNIRQIESLAADSQLDSFYLHSVVHCLWLHIAPVKHTEPSRWNLACDIAAFFLSIRLLPTLYTVEEISDRQELCQSLFPETILTSAASLYRALSNLNQPLPLEELQLLFKRDDHVFWYESGGKGLHLWRTLSKASNAPGIPQKKRFGLTPGSRTEQIELRKEAKYDFRSYLRRFTTTAEELQLDLDSFDYIPYLYGINSNDHMPFIEPLEYTEANKIEELVIAIDTSGSCDGDLVQQFLAETRRILTDRQNFFRRMNVHMIQCDSMIQSHARIHSVEEWNHYISNIKIEGRGGTDFTPVFTYVERLISDGEFRNLKGLLYFTDGDGVYPRTIPPYETAFVFSDRRFLEYPVPEWIHCLCLDL